MSQCEESMRNLGMERQQRIQASIKWAGLKVDTTVQLLRCLIVILYMTKNVVMTGLSKCLENSTIYPSDGLGRTSFLLHDEAGSHL